MKGIKKARCLKRKNKLPTLKYLIENESFITCPFLSTDQFISYCKDRDLKVSRKQLEQFEKLGVFSPIARVRYPKIKIKIEHVGKNRVRDLGILKDDEEWSGDIREEYEGFWFEREYAESWLKEGLLWDPHSKPFQAWETFKDEEGDTQIESFYSVFQCYDLYHLIMGTQIELGMEYLVSYTQKEISKLMDNMKRIARQRIALQQKGNNIGKKISAVCQIISNRYFPKTQSDRRSTQTPIPSYYFGWSWHKYCRNWDAKAVLRDIGIAVEDLKRYHEKVCIDAKNIDPLERWYSLVSFVSIEEKKKLKGRALLAQAYYAMEHMLRLFYEEITNNKLHPPNNLHGWKDKIYGRGVTQNELQYLEFLTNQYHLNPRPKLILVVEGDGEAEQFPCLSEKLLGYLFAKLSIEVVNIHGIGGFTGEKRVDKYGALERFIDANHHRQTIVFLILDREGRVLNIKDRLVKAPSKYYPKRTVTKEEYIHIWNKNIEFDNFSLEEIARGMTRFCEERYKFTVEEIENCEKHLPMHGDPLSRLFKEKLSYALSKPKLLGILCEFIRLDPEKEFNDKGQGKRPIVQVLQKVCRLARMNYQPASLNIWKENQESGYFGDLLE